MNPEGDFLVSLDLGSSMTRALVAEVRNSHPGQASSQPASPLRFLGCGEVESQGWRKGTITDLGLVTASVRKAVQQAEAMAGVAVESAVVGVGGPHIQGLMARGRFALSSRPREVTREDVRRVIETSRNISLPKDREILHMIPQEFVLDSQEGIQDPVGMQGSRLEVRVYVLTGSVAASQNIVTAVNRAGILVETQVLEALAVGEAVVTAEEAELGTLVALIGAGSSQLVAYRQGGLRMSAEVAIGGDHFTSDVAIGLHTSLHDAGAIQKMFGAVFPNWTHEGTSFEVPGLGDRPSRLVPRRVLLEILEPRAQELLGFALEELRRHGLDQQLGAGVVLCGGVARLPGICDLAEQVFSAPARLGLPSDALAQEGLPSAVVSDRASPPRISDFPDTLDFPEYTTLVSLLWYGLRVRKLRAPGSEALGGWWGSLLGRGQSGPRP